MLIFYAMAAVMALAVVYYVSPLNPGRGAISLSGNVSGWKVLAVLGGVAVFALYFTGRLDHLLYHVGLNYHDCGENGYGAVFCGDQLTQYREHLRNAGISP
jgi:hypothetical protein